MSGIKNGNGMVHSLMMNHLIDQRIKVKRRQKGVGKHCWSEEDLTNSSRMRISQNAKHLRYKNILYLNIATAVVFYSNTKHVLVSYSFSPCASSE
jgi:hypothetical protein